MINNKKRTNLDCQLVVLRFQKLVTKTRDSRRLQDVVQRGNILVVGLDENFQHTYFADVTVETGFKRRHQPIKYLHTTDQIIRIFSTSTLHVLGDQIKAAKSTFRAFISLRLGCVES